MKKLIFVICILLMMASCTDKKYVEPNPVAFENGVFIGNEGLYNTGNGTVSFYNSDNEGAENEIFFRKNGFVLGNVLQSIVVEGEKVYLVVNNSGKIEIADKSTMASIGTISGFRSPRNIEILNSQTALVSDWHVNNVKIVDLNLNVIIDSIPTGQGPECIVLDNLGKVFISNVGGWSNDSTLTILNSDLSVDTTIEVGHNPQSMVLDKDGKLWILCSGKYSGAGTSGKLVRLNTSTLNIELNIDFSDNTKHPANLAINNDGDRLYYLSDPYSGTLMSLNISETTEPSTALVSRPFYSMGVDPKNEDIYGADPMGFVQNGIVYRYNKDGIKLDSIMVGIIPRSFTFFD